MSVAKSHLTAISRKRASAPTRYLIDNGLLSGEILDYGCGRGADVNELERLGYAVCGYDPHYRPHMPSGQFDTVICNYVLNVLPEAESGLVEAELFYRVKPGGTVFVAVRNDQKALNGITSRGTYQRDVNLSEPWELIKKNSSFKLYRLDKPSR